MLLPSDFLLYHAFCFSHGWKASVCVRPDTLHPDIGFQLGTSVFAPTLWILLPENSSYFVLVLQSQKGTVVPGRHLTGFPGSLTDARRLLWNIVWFDKIGFSDTVWMHTLLFPLNWFDSIFVFYSVCIVLWVFYKIIHYV